jgi:hypothetical protein
MGQCGKVKYPGRVQDEKHVNVIAAEHRTLFKTVFGPPALNEYLPVIQDASRTLLRGFLESPDSFMQHLRR